MTQGKTPENTRQPEGDRRCGDEVKHEPGWLPERFDEDTRGNVSDDHDRNDPAEDEAEDSRINHIGVARDVEKIEVAVNQALGADDPETDGGQAEHDRVMHRDAEHERGEVEQDRHRTRHEAELRQ